MVEWQAEGGCSGQTVMDGGVWNHWLSVKHTLRLFLILVPFHEHQQVLHNSVACWVGGQIKLFVLERLKTKSKHHGDGPQLCGVDSGALVYAAARLCASVSKSQPGRQSSRSRLGAKTVDIKAAVAWDLQAPHCTPHHTEQLRTPSSPPSMLFWSTWSHQEHMHS